MLPAKDIKRGMIVSYQDSPCLIEAIQVQTPSARGAATLYKFRARNLLSRQKVDFTLKGTEGLEEANFERRPVTFMYTDANSVHFLDGVDYNEYVLSKEQVSDELNYLKEGLEGIFALIFEGECVGIQLPVAVELRIVQCDPYVRGASATGRTKPAVLETGLVVQVPEYMSEGEVIKVDTRTGEFLSRASS